MKKLRVMKNVAMHVFLRDYIKDESPQRQKLRPAAPVPCLYCINNKKYIDLYLRNAHGHVGYTSCNVLLASLCFEHLFVTKTYSSVV